MKASSEMVKFCLNVILAKLYLKKILQNMVKEAISQKS